MRRMTYFVMALAMVLGFTQCKKEQIEPQNDGNTVSITLEVNNGNKGSRAEVVPPHVNFIEHDTILVASNGKYVGYLVHNGASFSGNISDPTEGEPLYFYFLGNKIKVSTLTPGTTDGCTVNISDQTDCPHLPVISMGVSINRSTGETVNYSSEVSSYEAQLHNHCSLMKFNVTTASEAAICITGMNNKVTVDFSKTAEMGTGLGEGATDNGFKYGKDDEGIIKMVGSSSEERWIIVLPQTALEEGDAYSVYSEDNAYFGTRPALTAITTDQYLNSGVSMTVNTPGWDGDLSKLPAGVSERYATATNGMIITGTLSAEVKVSIADGATVTLNGANINNVSKSRSVSCAGITCKGSANINLYSGSINNINSSSDGYPGIQAGPSGNTLTIEGTGSLSAQGGSNAPGIGGGNGITCGNISLLGGSISACGGDNAPGLGCGPSGSCGNINISRNVEKINVTGGSGASTSIGTSAGSSLTIDDVADPSYINTGSFVYHPVNLSTLTSNYIAKNGDVLSGTLNNNVTISVNDNVSATITLSSANITYEGLVCYNAQDVKLVFFGYSVMRANSNAGIRAPLSGSLIIDGDGSIVVQSLSDGCAGIGGNNGENCGNIRIKGGSITSCGGASGAGIGSSQNASCGNIEIEGGTISATGGAGAAGIGSGQGGTCGNINIEGGAVTANGGDGASNIGAGFGGSCGTITLPLPEIPEGALSGLFSVSETKQVRFSQGNLLNDDSDDTFADNQYTYGGHFGSDSWESPSSDWYALSPEEWEYLYNHSTYGFATVNGIHGLIILPDNYTGSAITAYDPDDGSRDLWGDNSYSGDAWTEMENNGVVFLPAAGYLSGDVVQDQGYEGNYLTSSSSSLPVCFKFENQQALVWIGSASWNTIITANESGNRHYQYSVRLVRTE